MVEVPVRTMWRGGWIAFGGALGIWFSPEAAIVAGAVVFMAGWLEQRVRLPSGGGSQ